MIGKKFNRLLVLYQIPTINKKLRYRVVCECGGKMVVDSGSLTSNNTKSCGCLQKEWTLKKNTTHGLTHTPLYEVWCGIKKRCYDKNCKAYKDYGGRGIIVCEEWINNYKLFYDWGISHGWKKGLEIDRENNNSNYEPSNCRFVTKKVNMRNTRQSKLSIIMAAEIRKIYSTTKTTHQKLSKLYNVSPFTIGFVLRNKT